MAGAYRKDATTHIQIGVIAIRNPTNKYEILKTIPIYEISTTETKEAQNKVLTDIANTLAEKLKQYVDAGGSLNLK